MSVGFVLLAFCTSFDITADKGSKAGPPEFGSNKLTGFKEARVSGSGFVIMTLFKNGTAEGVIGGDVNITLVVGEDSGFDLPVGKARAEGKGNVLMHRLKHL